MTTDTKEIILDSAERLFAEQGFGDTSLRNITTHAGVNLASVNYHFGSKDALIEAVFERRVVPMTQERLTRLDALQHQYSGGLIPLDELIAAYVGPALELSRDSGQGGALFLKLLGRTYTEPMSVLHDAIRGMYGPAIERYKQAFAQALPELPPEELYWRMHFMIGLLAFLMTGTDMMRLIASSKLSDSMDTQSLIERLCVFLSAGMRSPMPVSTQSLHCPNEAQA